MKNRDGEERRWKIRRDDEQRWRIVHIQRRGEDSLDGEYPR